MKYQVIHITEYEYFQPVSLCHNIARLSIRNTNDQQCERTRLQIDPLPDIVNEYEDFFGNKVIYFAIQQEHKRLCVKVETQVEKYEGRNGINEIYNLPWEDVLVHISIPGESDFEAGQYISETEFTRSSEDIKAFAMQSFTPRRAIYDAAMDLMRRIYTEFEFKPGFTTIATPLATMMLARKGVCQDFAHLAIACFRTMGLPARYISGYIETVPLNGLVKLFGVDATHAWFSIFIPNAGWFDFDPTNNMIPGNQHLTIGWGRDYADITPLKGVILSSGPHKLSVSVDVRRME